MRTTVTAATGGKNSKPASRTRHGCERPHKRKKEPDGLTPLSRFDALALKHRLKCFAGHPPPLKRWPHRRFSPRGSCPWGASSQVPHRTHYLLQRVLRVVVFQNRLPESRHRGGLKLYPKNQIGCLLRLINSFLIMRVNSR